MGAGRNMVGRSWALAAHVERAVGEAAALVAPARLSRRRYGAEDVALLGAVLRRGLMPLAFGAGAAALVVEPTTALGVRLGGAAGTALVLALVTVPLRRTAERLPLLTLHVALYAGTLATMLLEALAHSGQSAEGETGLRSLSLALVAATGELVAAAAAAALARLPAARRRVLLVDGARPEDAAGALGDAPLVAIGVVRSEDAAQLQAVAAAGIDDVVVGRRLARSELAALAWGLRDARVRIHVPGLAADAAPAPWPLPPLPTAPSGGGFVSYRRSAMRPAARACKRAVDVLVAAAALALLAPVLLVCIALVKLSSPGPVFFHQERLGLRGGFRLIKFRTMRDGAHREHATLITHHGNHFKLRCDGRVHPVGRLLRRFSLDELPQLFQVLSGEMSLVGPRPPMVEEVARYTTSELRRLGCKPGLTGLWQVSGRADLSFADCVALDARYIEEWSPALELSILLATPRAVLGGKGAY